MPSTEHKTRRLSKERLREHLEETTLIDGLGWVCPAGLLEATVRCVVQKVVVACDCSVPHRKHRQARGSMYWWNENLAALRRECLAAPQKFTRSKGDALLLETSKRAKAALRRGIKKSRLQFWTDLIGEVEKDLWGLAFKTVTKRLVTRRKTPGLNNPDRVKYTVRSLFPHVEPFQRQDQSSCGWNAQGKHSAGDRRGAERDPQRGDRGMPRDPPRSL